MTGTYMKVIEKVQRDAVSGMNRLLDGTALSSNSVVNERKEAPSR